ncbi:hypothetical protein [Corallococcus macrosporus]|uniref:Uncharacterized protein n=1 Tax=Corallococcus macrosporus DSM 14697 TaxID=1189310 RepID=A0A250JRQ6_9BACT|nr:hypothetical protein [Corallococcus macrosporus]ATB46338.1 hypothetical protein MYMAC_001930 [Corallococcus macrosporus DSM 14697]
MERFELSVGDPGALKTPITLTAVGQIFRTTEKFDLIHPPLFDGETIVASPTGSTILPLAPGKYAYIFDIQRGEGKFSVSITRENGTFPLVSRDDYDTQKDGLVNHSFTFRIA